MKHLGRRIDHHKQSNVGKTKGKEAANPASHNFCWNKHKQGQIDRTRCEWQSKPNEWHSSDGKAMDHGTDGFVFEYLNSWTEFCCNCVACAVMIVYVLCVCVCVGIFCADA